MVLVFFSHGNSAGSRQSNLVLKDFFVCVLATTTLSYRAAAPQVVSCSSFSLKQRGAVLIKRILLAGILQDRVLFSNPQIP
jgi:hypothetical protein